ncbi:hypothetical protein BGW42_006123 [Actinomortierella wolfii]|nr:hypothetical protein BGW42_006123 [Actinomortierella wolfii]
MPVAPVTSIASDAEQWTLPRPSMGMNFGNSSTLSVHQQPQTHVKTTPSGLRARLELESDTVEIYDRSNDSFQYSLKGEIELDWKTNAEILLREARIDFMGFADSAVIRQEAAASNTGSINEASVYHTTDTIPTPLMLAQALPPNMEGAEADAQRGHEVLPIDLTIPGHLPESMTATVGSIRYEIQVLLTFALSSGTSAARTETLMLSKPVLVHRITYPSAQLQPRVVMGLDSGGVEIQAKLPRQMHCESALLAVEIDARPRTRNIKLKKLRVVFEQIETDRFTRSGVMTGVPRAVPWTPGEDAPLTEIQSALPPTPRLVTTTIAQPLEVDLEGNIAIIAGQPLQLQLVLSPNLCVDVHSQWIQVHHLLRVEVEYFTMDETKHAISEETLENALAAANSAIAGAQDATYRTDAAIALVLAEDAKKTGSIEPREGNDSNHQDHPTDRAVAPEDRTSLSGAAARQGDAPQDSLLPPLPPPPDEANQDPPPPFSSLPREARSPLPSHAQASTPSTSFSSPIPISHTVTTLTKDDTVSGETTIVRPASELSGMAQLNSISHGSLSVATEEIPIRVVRVVKTGLVDATTLAQAAGETEVGLPTYESVIEATGLPAYVEEKDEEEYEEAEASGTAAGVLGGAARLIEQGEDPQ